MSAKAVINPTWKWKWVIMSVALFLYGVYCIYDGKYAYPNHNKHVAAFQEYKEKRDNAISDTIKAEINEQWAKTTRENGWSEKDPGEPHSESDIEIQWYMLYFCWTAAVLSIGWLAYNLKQPLFTTESTLTGPGGKDIPFEAMTKIDKELWISKGIAYVEYDHNGKKGAIKVDDWIYQGAGELMDDIEQKSGIIPDEGTQEEEVSE